MIFHLLLYNFFIKLYWVAANLLSFINPKAKQWVSGRKNLDTQIQQTLANNTSPTIWVHCASLGEFEQAKPVIEALYHQYPAHKILVTFFSPSGYTYANDYSFAHYKFYLPLDSKKNAAAFLATVKPSLIIYVKYEFWYYYLTQAKQLQIPTILVSSTFRANQPFFTWYGNLHKEMLHCFTHIFVQTKQDKQLLNLHHLQNVTVSGDTRYDRVFSLAQQPFDNEILLSIIHQFKQVIVCGSTWVEDDKVLHHYCNTHPEILFLIAPHHIDEDSIKDCEKLYSNAIRFTSLQQGNPYNKQHVVIVNVIGLLNKLYRCGTINFIGGGFGSDGVHNVLEAAVYGKPILHGSEFEKFVEAKELVRYNGAIAIDNSIDLEAELNQLLSTPTYYHTIANNVKDFMKTKSNATPIIMHYIKQIFA